MRKSSINKTLALVTLGLIVSACANTGANYRPIIDSKGIDFNRYEADLKECQSYAQQTADAGQSAAAGALVGALLGAAISHAAGSRYDHGAAARVGAVSGAAGAGVEGETNQRNIIRKCLAGRGYHVLQ